MKKILSSIAIVLFLAIAGFGISYATSGLSNTDGSVVEKVEKDKGKKKSKKCDKSENSGCCHGNTSCTKK